MGRIVSRALAALVVGLALSPVTAAAQSAPPSSAPPASPTAPPATKAPDPTAAPATAPPATTAPATTAPKATATPRKTTPAPKKKTTKKPAAKVLAAPAITPSPTPEPSFAPAFGPMRADGVLLSMLANPAWYAQPRAAPADAAESQTQASAFDPQGAATPPQGAAAAPSGGPSINFTGADPGVSRTVMLILLVTVGSVAPAILLLMTSFTRFVVVLALTRNGLGLQGIPPTQVLIGLALFMTFFTMGPVFADVNREAVQPALQGRISATEAIQEAFVPLKAYMLREVDAKDVKSFSKGARSADEVSASALIPAYVVSELRKALLIGFVIFVPFLVIDLVVSSTLMSLGMVMVPPVMISLPLKLLLFVLVDGWGLIVRSLMASVGGSA